MNVFHLFKQNETSRNRLHFFSFLCSGTDNKQTTGIFNLYMWAGVKRPSPLIGQAVAMEYFSNGVFYRKFHKLIE